MSTIKIFVVLAALLMAVTLIFGINSAKIKACDSIGGTTTTNFGFVVDCKPPSLFP